MARVLLIKARFLTPDNQGIVPPLGIMGLASYLRSERGHEVRIVETGFRESAPGDVDRALRGFRPHLVGVSALTLESPSMRRIAAQAKGWNPEVPVVVGGPHASSYPEEILQDPHVDYVVLGEGERTLLELLDALEGGSDPEGVPGIAYRGGGSVRTTPPRAPLAEPELDRLPFPAWDLVDLGGYARHKSMSTMGLRPYMALFTSRGCPYRCTYCHVNFGKEFRGRSPENVLREIGELVERHGIRDFEFIDDIFNWDLPRAKRILDGIAARYPGTRIHFPNGLRCDRLDDEFLLKAKAAGLTFLCVAVETASLRLQGLIKKNLHLDRIRWTIETATRMGIFTNGFFMMGFPTETRAEILDTIDFAVRSRLHQALFFIVTPFRGTELHARHQDAIRRRPESFSDYDYFRADFNMSTLPDEELFALQRLAWRRFYLSPRRAWRILRDHPRKRFLPRMAWMALRKIFAFTRGNPRPADPLVPEIPPLPLGENLRST